jgi:hypothetical protein
MQRALCIAFPTGHRLDQQNRVEISDVAGETYLRRINCEYRDYLADQLRSLGLAVRVGFQERARGLDPDDGGGRVRGLLPARILADNSRRAHTAGDRSRGGSRGAAGVEVWPALVTGGDELYPRDPLTRLGAGRYRRDRLNGQGSYFMVKLPPLIFRQVPAGT